MGVTLVFLPGIGADHRLFKYQTAVFPNSYAADWIDPLPEESLEQYAVRFAEAIRLELHPPSSSPIIVCGLSLGGMMAPYVAHELGAAGYILLASIRQPEQFPRQYYFDWRLMRLCPPFRTARLFVVRLLARFFLCFPCLVRCFVSPEIVHAFVKTPLSRWAGLSRMMFDWAYCNRAYRSRQHEKNLPCATGKPTLHIHGTNDWLLPIRLTHPDIRLEGAGHLPVLTHPDPVNENIAAFCEKVLSNYAT